jgi:hypothetical protein
MSGFFLKIVTSTVLASKIAATQVLKAANKKTPFCRHQETVLGGRLATLYSYGCDGPCVLRRLPVSNCGKRYLGR